MVIGDIGIDDFLLEMLDEAAVLACMAYVELNPIRAKMANTPEQSDFTSLKLRVSAALKGEQPKRLLPFIGNERAHQPKGIAFSLKDCLELVDETGRIIRDDKRGAISATANNILNRLNIPADNWMKIVAEFGEIFHGPVGTLQEFNRYCEHLEKRRRHFSTCKPTRHNTWSLQPPSNLYSLAKTLS